MTIQRAFEIIKDEMPYESGVINEALKMDSQRICEVKE